MKKAFNKFLEFINNRYLILYIIVIIIAIVYIFQLFNLQIINGKDYREKSEKRMLRTEEIVATRGEIYDRNGVVLATSKGSYDIKIYKVRVSVEEQNNSIVKLIEILESNNDKIYSTFPINDNLDGFNFQDDESAKAWKKGANFKEDATFDEVIDSYIKKYGLENFSDRKLQTKIIKIKYEANLNGYSLFNSVTVAKDISQKSVAQITEIKSTLYGITIAELPKRYYTNSNLFSHVIGYVSGINGKEYEKLKSSGEYTINSIIGKSGIEESFEKYLKGTNGERKVETDSVGNVSSEYTSKEAVSGNNVTLTIDYRLQSVAETALESTIAGLKDGTLVKKKIPDVESGSVVVLDVQTGEVLAMANYPNYDTNLFTSTMSQADWAKVNDPVIKPMYNRAISGTYAPGSTYKMLVGIAGLEKGVITTDEKILDKGVYPYGHNPKCWIYTQYGTTHGYVNIGSAIKQSCNYFFYEVGRRLGISNIVEYAKIFGLGQKTGIEIAGEATGTIAGENAGNNWYLGQTLSSAIGQEQNAFTPLQLANYISAIANGGTLNKVSAIKGISNDTQGTQVSLKEIEEYASQFTGVKNEAKNLGINPDYIKAVKEGMLAVTNEIGGTSYLVFKNSNIQVAGKTGTAQLTSGSNDGIFVGFAPYDNPKIAVVAVIKHGGEGTYTANVVRPIMEEYFNITQQDKQNEREQNVVDSKVEF